MQLSSLGIALLLVGVLFSYVFGKVAHARRLLQIKRDKTVIAEYDIPHKLTPAELGYLVDHKFSDNELLATIFLLLQKGHLRLVKHEANNPFIEVTSKVEGRKLLQHDEIAVLVWIENQKLKNITLEDIRNLFSHQAGIQDGFKSEVYASLTQKGYLHPYSYFSITKNQSAFMAVMSLLVTFALIALIFTSFDLQTSLNGEFQTLDKAVIGLGLALAAVLLWPVSFLYVRLLGFVYRETEGLPVNATDLLDNSWQMIAGYQLFLKTVEFSRMEADPRLDEQVLPYCIGFGYKPKIDDYVK